MNADSLEDFLISIAISCDLAIRRSAWKFIGMPTVIIRTNAGLTMNRYSRFDKRGMYATDVTGRISLKDDGTTDQMFAKSWAWAPWCNVMTVIDPEMKTHWIGRMQARGEIDSKAT